MQIFRQRTSTKIVGVGGAGISVVNRMIDAGLPRTECFAADLDPRSLRSSKAAATLELKSLHHGLISPEFGHPARARRRESSLAQEKEISIAIGAIDTLVIVAGLGGHTGSGVAPVIGEIAKHEGVTTAGVFMLPFSFEGKGSRDMAYEAVKDLHGHLDVLLTVAPDRFLPDRDGEKVSVSDAFRLADSVMTDAVSRVLGLLGSDSVFGHEAGRS